MTLSWSTWFFLLQQRAFRIFRIFANIQRIPFRKISSSNLSSLLNLLIPPFLSEHSTSVSGCKIVHGPDPKCFSISFCIKTLIYQIILNSTQIILLCQTISMQFPLIMTYHSISVCHWMFKCFKSQYKLFYWT